MGAEVRASKPSGLSPAGGTGNGRSTTACCAGGLVCADASACPGLLESLDSIGLAAFACDSGGHIAALNSSYAKQAGLPTGEVLGHPYWQVHPRLEGPLPGCISHGKRRKHTRQGEVRDLAGAWFAYRLHDLPGGRDRGAGRIMICTVEDISARKHAELARQLSERRFRTIVENVTDIITIMAPDGTIRYTTPSVHAATGYSPRSLVGRNAFAYIHPEDAQRMREQIGSALRSPGEAYRSEYRARHRGGSYRTLEAVGQAIDSGNGGPEIVLSARDVTERRETEERYRSIFNAAGEGISVRDLRGRLLDLNPAYCRMLGYRREEMIGRPLEQIVDPSHRGAIDAYRRRLQEESEAHIECVLRHRSGRRIPVEAYGIRHVYRGQPAVLAFIRDISERKQAEIKKQQDAEALRRTLEDTVTAISLALDKRDPYTGGHERRVATISLRIAEELGLDKQTREGVFLGALVHDVGKIHIPLEILNRPGRLSPPEFAIIKSHSAVGYEILNNVHFDWPIAEIALQHHERLDGSGYPHGLRAEDILPEAKILAVADVVEAMASHRPYRPGLGPEAALAEVRRRRGTGFDPDAVDACVHLFERDGLGIS